METKIELTREEQTQLEIRLAIDALDNGNLRQTARILQELISELEKYRHHQNKPREVS